MSDKYYEMAEVFELIIPFRLDEVKLMDKDASLRRELIKNYLATFDVDRLMHTFRINAGIPSRAKPLGGWEDVNGGLRGHFVGHFLSACAKFSFADQDEALKLKACTIVDVMEQCAQPSGYVSAFDEEVLNILELEENRNVWAPYYTLHKILQGLIDCYRYLDDARALKLAVNLARYISNRFAKLSDEKIDGILRCTRLNPANEFGGIGDACYSLYEITGDASLLKLAQYFDRDYFLAPLAAGEDILTNLHANTHLPIIISAMHRYELTGEEKYKLAAVHFYQFLRGRTFANGSNSSKATDYLEGTVSEKSEHWGDYGSLGDALTGGESESCCAHNTERILERLFQWSQDVEYLDHMESLKYNAIINSASGKTGLSQYHQPMGSCAVKKFSDPYDSFWCCTASGVEAMSELQKNIWFKDTDMILLNSFISSAVLWNEKNVKITQHTQFPDALTSTLVISADKPTAFTLVLKENHVMGVKVNSTRIEGKKKNGFIFIERVFQDQDVIEIQIAAPVRLAPLLGDENLAAVMYGSILLAQVGEMKSFTGISNRNIKERLVRCEQDELEFVLTDDYGNSATFKPLYRIEHEQYTVYVDFTGRSLQNRFSFAKDGSTAYEEM